MANIDKTVKSKYPPKQKNVNWIDTSGDKPEMKTFFNGKWSSVGGSGVDSTNPTEADVNKVWQVTPVLKETKTETRWIIPERTMQQGDIYDADTEYFTEGAIVIVNFDGIEYECSVSNDDGLYYVVNEAPIFSFERYPYDNDGYILFHSSKEDQSEHTISMRYKEETPIYDYNWAQGVKIPIPTAEDEGKILVVTKVEGDNTSIIVPEQPVPADTNTPLTDVDLTKFVVGNTVKVTITLEENDNDTPAPIHIPDYSGPVEDSEPANDSEQGGSSGTPEPVIPEPATSQTITVTGVIEEDNDEVFVSFDNDGNNFEVWQTGNLLYTDATARFGPNSTIKLECIESNYEYQLSNSGYTVTKSYRTYLPEQDIATAFMESFACSDEYSVDTLLVVGNTYKVIFNGVEYELVCFDDDGVVEGAMLGAAFDYNLNDFDFSTYPFVIMTYTADDDEPVGQLITPEAGTYSLKIDEVIEEVTITPEFEAAVKFVIESMS